jgi:hypothetical protein
MKADSTAEKRVPQNRSRTKMHTTTKSTKEENIFLRFDALSLSGVFVSFANFVVLKFFLTRENA